MPAEYMTSKLGRRYHARRMHELLTQLPQLVLKQGQGRKNLLLLSHMRSGSSLISHILGSHPQIAGYSERHKAYRDTLDVLLARAEILGDSEISTQTDKPLYIFDKVLHNTIPLCSRVLNNQRTTILVSVREPLSTLASCSRLAELDPDMACFAEPLYAADYYVQRLAFLNKQLLLLRTPPVVLFSEALFLEPAPTLEVLTKALGLTAPLTSEYKKFRYTGRPGFGDSGNAIRTGKVITPAGVSFKTDIPPWIQKKIFSAYQQFVNQLPTGCQLIGSPAILNELPLPDNTL